MDDSGFCYKRMLVCFFGWLRDYTLSCAFGSLLILFKSALLLLPNDEDCLWQVKKVNPVPT